MSGGRTLADASLIDALECETPVQWSGAVWRSCREGRDPLSCSATRARWDDGDFDVLYAATSSEGCIEEMRFHLGRGQPVIPDIPVYLMFELRVSLQSVLDISADDTLVELGVNLEQFGRLPYLSHRSEYVRSQEIAAASHFLDFDGLLVPSARSRSPNLVIFCDKLSPDAIDVVNELGPVSLFG